MTHNNSLTLGQKIRELCMVLHNENELSDVALELISSTMRYFERIDVLKERFEADCKTLEEIIERNQKLDKILADLKKLQSKATELENYTTDNGVEDFIAKIKSLNSEIRKIETNIKCYE